MAVYEFDSIETPENVELLRPLAGLGSRLIAGVVDHFIIFLGVAVVGIVAGIAGWSLGDLDAESAQWWFRAAIMAAAFAGQWIYFFACEAAMNGQTPGKRFVRIRVVKEGGGPVTLTDLAIRNLVRVVDLIGAYAVGGIVMFVTRKGQRLGDLAAGTVVVTEREPDYRARTDAGRRVTWEREATPAALRATGLTASEFRVLTNYWSRRNDLTPASKGRILPRLLAPAMQRGGYDIGGLALPDLEAYVGRLVAMADQAERAAAAPRADDIEWEIVE